MSENNWPWFHRSLGRMETERLLVDCSKDGCFLIRPSETKKGAYVLSLIHQQRIHHYRILPNEDFTLSVQAQEGVQQKKFSSLDGLVTFYSQPKRGIVCALVEPISPNNQTESEQQEEEEPDDDDSDYDDPDDSEPDPVGGDDKKIPTVSKYLLAFLPHIDLNSVDQAFQDRLKYYINSSVADDIDTMSSAAPGLNKLKGILTKEVESTHKELDKLISQVDVLQNLLERVGGAKHPLGSTNYRSSSAQDSSFESLRFKLSECSASLQKLETTAFCTFKGLASGPGSSLSQPSSFQGVSSSLSEDVSFDVKTDQNISGFGGKKNLCLKINIKQGTLTITKPGEGGIPVVYQHYQMLQLTKSRDKEQKLGILFDSNVRSHYTFSNMQSREQFCQLIQSTRNKHRSTQDPDSVSVFIGSWNMGDSPPPSDISSWFRCDGWGRTLDKSVIIPHDIFVIGTQESGMGEKEWIIKVKSVLKNLFNIDYEKVDCSSLWGIRLVILAKPEHSQKISHVQHSQVRTGIGNTLGNKGAVGITFNFNNTSFAFICSHLTSGTEKCHRRNQNYHDILKGMASLKQKDLTQFDFTHQFHHMFFFGDLNYRVPLKPEDIISFAERGNVHAIYCSDQLKDEIEKKRVFVGYDEAPIEFPPTYRFKKGERSMSSYVYIKKKRSGDRINEPSYCDRVLWKSYPGTKINPTSYGCTYDVMTSDHSPVFSTFQISGVKQHASSSILTTPSMLMSHNTFIVLKKCSAKILTNSKTQFYIEVHSTCFEGVRKTSQNTDFGSDTDGALRPSWASTDHIIKILPASIEQAYLEEQHLLLMLKSTDSDEPYAECCISLRGVIGPMPFKVVRELIHQGMSVGEFECMIHVTLDDYKSTHTDSDRDLYGNLDFIRVQLVEDSVNVSELRNSSKPSQNGVPTTTTRPHRPSSGVDQQTSGTSRPNRTGSTSTPRPPMPLPPDRLGSGATTIHSRPPMPLPHPPSGTAQKRSDPPVGLSSTPPTSRPNFVRSPEPLVTADAPPVPTRRPNSSRPPVSDKPTGLLTTDGSQQGIRSNRPQPPVPARRTRTGDSPPTAPRSPLPNTFQTVQELLAHFKLQAYSQVLIGSGYDTLKFLPEITESDLHDLGITDDREKIKLLRAFKSAK